MNLVSEERNELPINWSKIDLENCVEILDSKRKPINSDEREERLAKKNVKKYPYYGATGQVGWIDDFLFDEELLLLGEDAAPFFEKTKNVAYIITGKTWVNNHAHVLRAVKDFTSNKYLCHYLNIFDYHNYVTGTTRLKLPQTPLKKIPIKLPPLSEQHRIVAKLEELFTKLDVSVAELKKAKAQIKRYRQSVLKHAFEGKLTEQWRKQTSNVKGETAEDLLAKIKEERKKALGKKYKELPPVDTTNLPQLPDGWVWTCLGEIITVSSGNGLTSAHMKSNGIYPVYGGNGVSGYYDKYMFEERKLIIGRVGAKCGVVHITEPLSWVTDNALIVEFNNLDMKFLFYLIHVLNLNQYSVSTAQPVISGAKIYPIINSLPPFKEQQQIVSEIERHFSVADETEKIIDQSLKQAERLRQSILKDAFSGKLVPQDPSEEHAEKLLERIRAERTKLTPAKKNKARYEEEIT